MHTSPHTDSPTYYERFREAFVTEMNEFVACCRNDLREFPEVPVAPHV